MTDGSAAPVGATVIQLVISRTREYDADEDGAAPLSPQRDLQNAAHMMIANPFRSSDVTSLFATHPPMGHRVERAGPP